MNYRLNYSVCPLHEEPLNYICLHTNCELHRVICAICREERHAQSHHTLPLKLYLSQKLQKLKCLTQSEVKTIQESLEQQKLTTMQALDDLGVNILEKISQLKCQFQKFYDHQLNSMRQSMNLINGEDIDVQKLELIQSAARAAHHYDEYLSTISQTIQTVSNEMLSQMQFLHPHQLLMDQYWVGHPEIYVNRSLLSSNNNDYKVAYLSKPISKNCKNNFKILKNNNNWIAVGICHSEVVQQRNFGFRYHTIGHGMYAISSNGGIWSHFKPDHNNKLGGPQFKQNETVTVGYDWQNSQVNFQMQNGSKYFLQVDREQKGTLHFCVMFYFQGDKIQAMGDMS